MKHGFQRTQPANGLAEATESWEQWTVASNSEGVKEEDLVNRKDATEAQFPGELRLIVL